MQITLTPQELIEFLEGPQESMSEATIAELKTATILLNSRYEDIKKSLEILLKGGKK